MKTANLLLRITLGLVTLSMCSAHAQTLIGSFDSAEGSVQGLSFLDNGTSELYGIGNYGTASNNIFGIDLSDNSQLLSISTSAAGSNGFTGVAISGGEYPGDTHYYAATQGSGFVPLFNPSGSFNGRYDDNSIAVGISAASPYVAGDDNFYVLESVSSGTQIRLGNDGSGDFVFSGVTISSIANLKGISFDPSGTNDLWAVDATNAYEYNTTTGTLITSFALPSQIGSATGVAFDTDNGDLYVSNGTSTIYQVAAVPEPKVGLLLFTGLSLLVGSHAFRKKAY